MVVPAARPIAPARVERYRAYPDPRRQARRPPWRSHGLEADGDPQVRDAGLVAAAQRIEQYEIAGYGCAAAMSLIRARRSQRTRTRQKTRMASNPMREAVDRSGTPPTARVRRILASSRETLLLSRVTLATLGAGLGGCGGGDLLLPGDSRPAAISVMSGNQPDGTDRTVPR
jgi:Domain of unknown function (DUF892)